MERHVVSDKRNSCCPIRPGVAEPRAAACAAVSKDFDQAIARRLRQARSRAGWTQEKLAEGVGIEPATLSRYETAKLPVPLEVLSRVGAVLGTKLGTLVDVQRSLPGKLSRPPRGGRTPRRAEEAELVAAWATLRPRDRRIVIRLCQEMKQV